MRVVVGRVDVREGVRTFTVIIAGCEYEIPELWAVAWCNTHEGDVLDAALAWREQVLLEADVLARAS